MATSEEDETGSREENDDSAMDYAPSVGLSQQVIVKEGLRKDGAAATTIGRFQSTLPCSFPGKVTLVCVLHCPSSPDCCPLYSLDNHLPVRYWVLSQGQVHPHAADAGGATSAKAS